MLLRCVFLCFCNRPQTGLRPEPEPTTLDTREFVFLQWKQSGTRTEHFYFNSSRSEDSDSEQTNRQRLITAFGRLHHNNLVIKLKLVSGASSLSFSLEIVFAFLPPRLIS